MFDGHTGAIESGMAEESRQHADKISITRGGHGAHRSECGLRLERREAAVLGVIGVIDEMGEVWWEKKGRTKQEPRPP
ncbi:hypothetical protein FRC09_019522, partial [Ceratobasidium sp. 395]